MCSFASISFACLKVWLKRKIIVLKCQFGALKSSSGSCAKERLKTVTSQRRRRHLRRRIVRTSSVSTLLFNINTLSIAVALKRALLGEFPPHNTPCSLFHFLRTVIGESFSCLRSSSSSLISPSGVRWWYLFWENDDAVVFFFATTAVTPPRDDFLISLSLSLSVPRVAVNNTPYSFFLRLVLARCSFVSRKMKREMRIFSFVCLPPFFFHQNFVFAFYFLETTCREKHQQFWKVFYHTNRRDTREK